MGGSEAPFVDLSRRTAEMRAAAAGDWFNYFSVVGIKAAMCPALSDLTGAMGCEYSGPGAAGMGWHGLRRILVAEDISRRIEKDKTVRKWPSYGTDECIQKGELLDRC